MALHKKILLVSWTLPPGKSGSVFVLQEIIKYFSSDELVVVGEKVPYGEPLSNMKYISSNPIRFRKGNRFLKWYRWFMVPHVTNEIIKVAKKEKCSAILCFFPDEIYLESARRAAKKLKLPFYPYFHNTYVENRTGVAKVIAKRIQERVFEQAKLVYVMSEGMVNFYKPIYPNINFKALVHPFNGTKADGFKGLKLENTPTVISFLGNLNESNLDAFSFFVKCIANDAKYKLKIISSTPGWFYAKHNLMFDNIELLNAVGDDELMGELQNSHLLLLPHGFTGGFSEVEYQTIFPTRTIQYFFSGVPIIGLMPQNCFLYQYLAKKNCASLLSEKDKSKLLAEISRISSDAIYAQNLVQNALLTSDEFKASNVLRELQNDLFFVE